MKYLIGFSSDNSHWNMDDYTSAYSITMKKKCLILWEIPLQPFTWISQTLTHRIRKKAYIKPNRGFDIIAAVKVPRTKSHKNRNMSHG